MFNASSAGDLLQKTRPFQEQLTILLLRLRQWMILTLPQFIKSQMSLRSSISIPTASHVLVI